MTTVPQRALIGVCAFVLGLVPESSLDQVAAAPLRESVEERQAAPSERPQQLQVRRILEQDPARNNLVDPPGYEMAELGTLGRVERRGAGPRPMILVPGFGFGGEIFEPVMVGREDRFTMYAVTLPGFGGTRAPPSPPEGTSFGEQTWTTGAIDAISQLMREEKLRDVVVVGHWLGGTQVAIELALRHPDRVGALVLLAGSARWIDPSADPGAANELSLNERIASIDSFMAPGWFKTVTRETWDDNNFLPGDYAANPVLGLRLWRMAAEPPLHAWVRYLNEFFAQDVTLKLGRLEVPTLLLHPGLEGLWHPEGNDYVRSYTHRSWGDHAARHPRITVDTIPDTRIVPWYDRPEAVNEAIDDFLESGASAPVSQEGGADALGGAAIGTGSDPPAINIIDLYGLRSVSESRVRRALGLRSGDPMPASADPLRERILAIPDVAEVDVTAMCCAERGGTILYVGIRETETRPVVRRAAPTGEVRLDSGVVAVGRKFEAALVSAVQGGAVDEDRSNGYSLSVDSTLRSVQEDYIDLAAERFDDLAAVLRGSADAEHRALAAQIIAYGPNRRSVARELLHAVQDPNATVRNNAVRALSVLAAWTADHPEAGVEIPADPFIELVNSVSWTDRNKGVAVLVPLTARRPSPLLSRLRERALPSLVEMASWKHPGHALGPFLILARIAGVEDEAAFRAWRAGNREAVISRVQARR